MDIEDEPEDYDWREDMVTMIIPPIKCNSCGREFERSIDYNRHMEKPINCEGGSDYRDLIIRKDND